MPLFRVHIVGQEPAVIEAANPDLARKEAIRRQPGAIVTKIKLCRENA